MRRAIEPTETILLYDGSCGLCDRAVRWLLARDRRRRLRFAPLQGVTARPYLAAAGHDLGTVVLVERGAGGERVAVRSEAALGALGRLGGAWALAAALLRLVPRRLADAAYRSVAQRRHRLAGACEAVRPTDERFLP